MNYHNIVHEDMRNGDGLRVTLFVSGCNHHCLECQNPQTWGFDSGIPFDEEALNEIGEELTKSYIDGITFSGGDPLAPENAKKVLEVINWIKDNFPAKTIWVYTGYSYEEIKESKNYNQTTILFYTDVLVDGEYKKDLRDTNLKWRGSSNQRVIDVQRSLRENNVVLWCD